MQAGIRVTPEQLQALSARVGGGSADIDATLAGLRASIEPLAAGEWAGNAAAEFHGLWAQWQAAARDLNEALLGISRLLSGAADAYSQAEAAIAASFRR